MLEFSKYLNDTWLRWSAASPEEAKVCIMGIPFDNAVSNNKGAAHAPQRMRELSSELSDTAEDFIAIRNDLLYDIGDIAPLLDWEKYFAKVEEEAGKLMRTGNFCLFIGGDHSVTIPLHKAFGKYQNSLKEDARIGVLHFDAHYDLCPEYDGHKWSHACTEARALDDVIKGENLHFAGVRVSELSELELMKENPGIQTETARDIYLNGIDSSFENIKKHFENYDAIYLTLDIDVLDPAFAPGTGTTVAGGLTSRELIELIKMSLQQLPIKAMDIVEVAPPLDVNDVTS